MRMFKKTVCFFWAAVLMIGLNPVYCTYAGNMAVRINLSSTAESPLPSILNSKTNYTDKILKKTVDGKYGDIEIRGSVPFASGLANGSLQSALNSRFDAQYKAFVSGSSENALSLTFRFDIVASEGYVSVNIYCTEFSVSAVEKVSTTVVDTNMNKITRLSDVMGKNGVKLANQYILGQIARDPGQYSSNFTRIDDNHDFYVSNHEMVIPFDAYEIAPGPVGIIEIKMDLTRIKGLTIKKGQYYSQIPSKYGVKMIQLKEVAEFGGYSLSWNGETRQVDIYQGKNLITSMAIGVNSYVVGKAPSRELECAPEILAANYRTYVPISFFEEILGMVYTVDPDTEDVLFSFYDEKDQVY